VLGVSGPAGLLAVFAALLVITGASAARVRPVPGEKAALAAVKKALASGRIDRAAAAADRKEIARAARLARELPSSRRAPLEVALGQIGALAGRLTKPRALAVFGQLRANDDYFAAHPAPRSGTDITGSDGIVYRYFAGRCFEFHPLANFGALNARVGAKDLAGTERLAGALAARATRRPGGRLLWEYYFRFDGGRPPWVSGMAQAVAAQAFARAAALATDESALLLHLAGAAYRAIPGRLTTQVAAGPWIRLYSFQSVPILNAQLQSVLSLESYAKDAGDQAAAALAAQMEQAAAATVSSFDSGYWSYYSLAGRPSPVSYHEFVLQLLRRLAPDDRRFAEEAGRFAFYLRQPPAFKLANASPGAVRFWLSKPALVSVETAAGVAERLSLGGGWHTLAWREPKHAGAYGVKITAVGSAGNSASFAALPIVRVSSAAHGHARAAARRTAAQSGSTATPPVFAAGAGIDTPAQAAQAESLGLRRVRMTIPWQPGETSPDSGTVSSLQSIPSSLGLLVELRPSELPADDTGRADLAHYAAALAQQTPSLADLVLAPAPSLDTASAYADALAAIRVAIDGVRSDVAVGPSFDGATSEPQQTALALGQELVRDGAEVDVVAFRPAPFPAKGVWSAFDAGRLESAFAKSLGKKPPVLVDGVSTPSTVPPSEADAYTGGTPPSAGADPPARQATVYGTAIGAASCAPGVVGVLLDRLVDDGAGAAPATGVYYASGDPKPAAAAVKREIQAVARGTVVCPGIGARVTPTTLTFPEQLDASSPASVELACDRDCLYLVTLDRGDRPVLARRGALAGGHSPETIMLPKRRLSAGGYRLDVRLVSRVNPSVLTRRRSRLLTVG
jgi:hypothetical protein